MILWRHIQDSSVECWQVEVMFWQPKENMLKFLSIEDTWKASGIVPFFCFPCKMEGRAEVTYLRRCSSFRRLSLCPQGLAALSWLLSFYTLFWLTYIQLLQAHLALYNRAGKLERLRFLLSAEDCSLAVARSSPRLFWERSLPSSLSGVRPVSLLHVRFLPRVHNSHRLPLLHSPGSLWQQAGQLFLFQLPRPQT